jgi:hypothetical protein
METLRLRGIQQPSRLERLLETYVQRRKVVPPGAYQIRDAATLPKELRRVLVKAADDGQVWSCWAHGTRLWLFVCDMSLPRSRERGTPVLQVSLYGEDANLEDTGSWTTDPQGNWSRCTD